jgi:hypothetical protein
MPLALARAVRDALNAAQQVTPPAASPFDTAFTAVAVFVAVPDENKLPLFNVTPAEPPLVAVVPCVDHDERIRQGVFRGDYEVDAAVYARVGKGPAAESASAVLMDLRQQIRDWFEKGLTLTVIGSKTRQAVLMGVGGPMCFDEALLSDAGIFCSTQTLKFAMNV